MLDHHDVYPQFTLHVWDENQGHTVESSEQEWNTLNGALDGINCVIEIEESYDAVVQNYVAYEQAQFGFSLAGQLDRSSFYERASAARRASALHLDNFLSTARAFLDITPKKLKPLVGGDLKTAFCQATHAAFDASEGYQFMEALRNYTQHRGSSITGMTWNTRRSDKGSADHSEDFRLIHTVAPRIDPELLRLDDKFKAKSLLDKLKDKRGWIDATPLVREYIKGLSSVLLKTRAALDPLEAEWWLANDRAIERLRAASTGRIFQPTAMRRDTPDDRAASILLATKRKNEVELLRSRNGKLDHLTRSQFHS